jgi:fatty-acyl-CoA synthase
MLGQMMDAPLTLELVRRRADRYGRERPLVTNTPAGPRRATIGDAIDRAARLAGALEALGIRPGDRVATLLWNQQEHLEAYVAVPCMGAVLHTLNLRLLPEQLAWIANDAEDRVLIADASLLPLVEAMRPELRTVEYIVVAPDDYELLLDSAPPQDGPRAWPELDERQAAAMCYTSGTTGRPKGVVYSHRSAVLHTLMLLFAEGMGLQPRDVVMPVVPMFHANAWGFPYGALMASAGLVLPGPLMQPAALAELLARERVTVAAGVPTIWHGVVGELEREPRDLSALRLVGCGGSTIPEVLMRGFDAIAPGVLLHAWGMTETSPIASIASLPAESERWEDEGRLRYRLTQGRPLPCVELRVIGFDGVEAAWDGETMGELEVRGPWVAASYWRARDPDRFGGGWFRTGDVAVGNPDGTFTIVDRTKDVIKSGGEWISSVELECILLEHPAVQEAAVVARADAHWSERPVACVVLREGSALALPELRDWLEGRVPRFWLPDDLWLLDELPKTGVGKLDKKRLRAEYAAEHAPAAAS